MHPTRRRKRKAVTVVVVSQDERAPRSWRVPLWLGPAIVSCLVCLLVLATLLATGYLRLKEENRALRSERSTETLRQREMRSVILIQQDQVRRLSKDVAEFEVELTSVRELARYVRGLLRLDGDQNVSDGSSGLSSGPPVMVPSLDEPVGTGVGGGNWQTSGEPRRGTDEGMLLALARAQDMIEMQAALPALLSELGVSSGEIRERVQRLDVDEPRGAAEIEKQLRLLAAAPHDWPTDSRFIISPFGYRVLGGEVNFHTGVDFPVWYGTKVRATKQGVVTSAGWKQGYGWVVELEHEMRFSTLYAHNSSLVVDVGDEVEAGQVIALSGGSGWTTGPHVHYEIRLDDKPVNPARYLDVGREVLSRSD